MRRDEVIAGWIKSGRLVVDAEKGLVFSTRSNDPSKPLGSKTKKGYLRVCINFSGKRQFHFMVHRIVWIAVNGVPPSGSDQVNHIDTIKTHNWISNLELVTDAQNREHAKANGLYSGNGRKDGIRDSEGRFGKKSAGRKLDGVEHSEYPQIQASKAEVGK